MTKRFSIYDLDDSPIVFTENNEFGQYGGYCTRRLVLEVCSRLFATITKARHL